MREAKREIGGGRERERERERGGGRYFFVVYSTSCSTCYRNHTVTWRSTEPDLGRDSFHVLTSDLQTILTKP